MLLDINDPQRMGLLSLGLRLMSTPGKFGAALGQSGLGALGDMQQIAAQNDSRKSRDLQQQLLMQQLEQAKALQEAKKAEEARRLAVEGAYRNSIVSPAQQALAGGGGPTVANAQAMQGLQPTIDQNRLIQGLMQADPMSAFQMLQPKAADYKVVDGALVQTNAPGGPKAVYERQKPVDWNQLIVTGPDGKPMLNTMLRDAKQQIAAAGAARINTGQKDRDWGTPPKDYVWARDDAGNVMTERDPKTGANRPLALPIGGSSDARDDAKAQGRNQALAAQTKQLIGTIDEAMGMVGPTTAGIGGMAASLPMTDARKLAGHITTIKANLGFDRLQQMRDMSPTGGALGQVAVQELQSLQATVAMLDQLQSPSDLRAAFEKIRGHYNRWLQTLEGGGSSGDAPAAGFRRYNPQTGRIE